MVAAGEKNTWPSIPRIRAHCLVEITLDKCVQRLRKVRFQLHTRSAFPGPIDDFNRHCPSVVARCRGSGCPREQGRRDDCSGIHDPVARGVQEDGSHAVLLHLAVHRQLVRSAE